jgi:hypothetical protein
MKRPMTMGLLFGPCLAGCSLAPSINVLGAYFPDWMFCISAAIALCLAVNAAARARGWLAGVPGHLLAVAYAALTTLLSLVGWLIFFHN